MGAATRRGGQAMTVRDLTWAAVIVGGLVLLAHFVNGG
jgi:hypothetical protein